MRTGQIKRNAKPTITLRGVPIYQGWLSPVEQQTLVDDLRRVIAAAPLFSLETRFGALMSVRVTAAGKYGWFSDRRGYRYMPQHPGGVRWPAIPDTVLGVWRVVTLTNSA